MECHLQQLQGRQVHKYEVWIPMIREVSLVSTRGRVHVRHDTCCLTCACECNESRWPEVHKRFGYLYHGAQERGEHNKFSGAQAEGRHFHGTVH